MRRKDREIVGEEIETILQKGEYGILSTVGQDGKPNVGQKLENISYCSEVCFVVVGDTTVQPEKFGTLYESVILTGQMMPSKDKQVSLVALLEKYSKEFLEKGMQYIQAAWDKTGTYVICPEQITGKAKRTPQHTKL